jgi:hypothetical protein
MSNEKNEGGIIMSKFSQISIRNAVFVGLCIFFFATPVFSMAKAELIASGSDASINIPIGFIDSQQHRKAIADFMSFKPKFKKDFITLLQLRYEDSFKPEFVPQIESLIDEYFQDQAECVPYQLGYFWYSQNKDGKKPSQGDLDTQAKIFAYEFQFLKRCIDNFFDRPGGSINLSLIELGISVCYNPKTTFTHKIEDLFE